MLVKIKLGTCYNNGNRCKYNGSFVCTRCSVLSGNFKKPILFESEMKPTDLVPPNKFRLNVVIK